ncbi:hypothetical protein FS763_04440 [Agrobacterium vitis]|uniref:hypothetical protein n=1 Tax=Allorhizobium ampelinum TaxID=3025782 RepID=UPI001F33AE8A|nr:hypothetical protein [Allorhizobium ampelinum]MCF1471175.1 hypothetical protein [Allorhizobium ampelinum]
MTDEEMALFIEMTTAASLAAKATLTLSIAGKPVSANNAVRCITLSGWINSNSPHHDRLVLAVHTQVEEMLAAAKNLSQLSFDRE